MLIASAARQRVAGHRGSEAGREGHHHHRVMARTRRSIMATATVGIQSRARVVKRDGRRGGRRIERGAGLEAQKRWSGRRTKKVVQSRKKSRPVLFLSQRHAQVVVTARRPAGLLTRPERESGGGGRKRAAREGEDVGRNVAMAPQRATRANKGERGKGALTDQNRIKGRTRTRRAAAFARRRPQQRRRRLGRAR